MHCSCVRQTELPNLSRLAADVLYHPDRSAPFYRYPFRTLDSYRAAAREVHLPEDRRAALISALRASNPDGPSLERLARPETVAVLTGQQVGLFSGPSYTIYKALHAAKLAEWLTANGVPAVPVFWLATEDHDFAEVDHAWVFNSEHRPSQLRMRATAAGQPVGDVTLEQPPLTELRQALEGLPFADEVVGMAADCYTPGRSMGAAFGALLRRILPQFGILQADPMAPAFRRLAAPALRAAVDAAPELSARVRERGRELEKAGYHAQVHVEEQTSFVFLLENNRRWALRRNGNEYVLNGRRFTSAELMDRAESLSPNALLRPVVQDSMLPTVAYVGGNAEIAYLAQSQVIYDALLGRMPVAVPRTGFTILDERSRRRMDRYDLCLPEFFHGEQSLKEHMAAKLIPATLAGTVRETATSVETVMERLRSEMLAFDPTLARALERSAGKISYQIRKIERKAGREMFRRDEQAARDAASLQGLICPERHLQERLYSILPFLAKHGLDLPSRIHETLELDCPDHRVLVL